MAILVMDTATDALGVGVGAADGELYSGVAQRILRGHSRLLQPSIQFVLTSSGRVRSDVEAIGIGVGPGSYTGVRMAVATGKAMAHAWGVPIIPIPTLDAIAQLAVPGKPHATGGATRALASEGNRSDEGKGTDVVLVMLYARRDRAFGGIYTVQKETGLWASGESALVRRIDEWLTDVRVVNAASCTIVHDFPDQVAQTAFAGGAAGTAMERGSQATHIVHWSDVSSGLPTALLRVAVDRQPDAISGDAIHALAPDYALPVEAEAKLEGKLKGGSDHEYRA